MVERVSGAVLAVLSGLALPALLFGTWYISPADRPAGPKGFYVPALARSGWKALS